MRNLFLAVLTASILGICGAAHAACPIPNPNNTPGNPPTFFDGCTLSAAGLNSAFATTASAAGYCPNIVQFGGVGDGTTDNTAAWLAAIASQSDQVCVSFPPGKFKFNSAISRTHTGALDSTTILGAGADTTVLLGGPPGSSFLTLTEVNQFNSVHIHDLSIVTPSACSSCTAIKVVQNATTTSEGYTAQSDFINVSIYGDDRSLQPTGSSAHYWGTGILLDGISNINFYGVYMQGIASNPSAMSAGVQVTTHGGNTPIVYNFTSSTFNTMNIGILLDPHVQGTTILQSNFVADNTCVFVPSGSGSGSQLAVTGGQMSCLQGVDIENTYGGVEITGVQFLNGLGVSGPVSTLSIAIKLGAPVQYVSIVGNVFAAPHGLPLTRAMFLSGAGNTGVVTGNTVSNQNIGIVVDTGAVGWVINPNTFIGNGNNIIDNAQYGNVINNEVNGAVPTATTGCGSGVAFGAQSTDQGGTIVVGTSPGSSCLLTFSQAFNDLPRCYASNLTSTARQVAATTASRSQTVLASISSLTVGDILTYHCDGFQ